MHFKRCVKLDWAGLDGELNGIFEAVNFAFFNLFVHLAVILTTALEAAAGDWLWTNFLFWFSGFLGLASLALSFGFDFLYVLLRLFASLGEFFFFSWSFFSGLFGNWSFFNYWSFFYYFWSSFKIFFGFFLSHNYPFAVLTSYSLSRP